MSPRGEIFELLGGFGRRLIFDDFLDRQKSAWKAHHSAMDGQGCAQPGASQSALGGGGVQYARILEWGDIQGGYRKDPHSLLTPVGSADFHASRRGSEQFTCVPQMFQMISDASCSITSNCR